MDNKVILEPRGKITALNVDDFKESFMDAIKDIKNPDIVVDMAEVYYISSVGLRLMMSLKKMASSIELINLSPDIYEVFSVTGLTEYLNVRRMYKEINIDGLEVLGYGATATVYRLNHEQIVKIFNEEVKEEDLLREQEETRKALLAGVPTMLSFDTVRADDRLGAIYEAFNFETLLSVYAKAPDEERKALIRKYAQTVRQMNSIDVDPEDFTDFKAITVERLEKAKKRLDDKALSIFRGMIDQIPDDHGFIHGDCHMGNLMMDQEGDLYVIDLGISGYGNSVFALSGVAHYKVFTELITDENAYKNKAVLSFAEGEELYHRFISEYCEDLDEKKRELVDQGVYLYCCLFSALEYVGTPLVTDDSFRALSDKIVKASDAGINYTEMFESLASCLQKG